METVVDIPLKSGEHYLMLFIPIQSESAEDDISSQATTLVTKNLLTWELISGIDKRIVYHNIEYSPDDIH